VKWSGARRLASASLPKTDPFPIAQLLTLNYGHIDAPDLLIGRPGHVHQIVIHVIQQFLLECQQFQVDADSMFRILGLERIRILPVHQSVGVSRAMGGMARRCYESALFSDRRIWHRQHRLCPSPDLGKL
jgi:hypothetical protein